MSSPHEQVHQFETQLSDVDCDSTSDLADDTANNSELESIPTDEEIEEENEARDNESKYSLQFGDIDKIYDDELTDSENLQR